jgi:hypothetical protein
MGIRRSLPSGLDAPFNLRRQPDNPEKRRHCRGQTTRQGMPVRLEAHKAPATAPAAPSLEADVLGARLCAMAEHLPRRERRHEAKVCVRVGVPSHQATPLGFFAVSAADSKTWRGKTSSFCYSSARSPPSTALKPLPPRAPNSTTLGLPRARQPSPSLHTCFAASSKASYTWTYAISPAAPTWEGGGEDVNESGTQGWPTKSTVCAGGGVGSRSTKGGRKLQLAPLGVITEHIRVACANGQCADTRPAPHPA